LDKVNPSSLILSGAVMLDHLAWGTAAGKLRNALQTAVKDGVVTYDLARQIENAKEVKCSTFAEAIVERL
jgi:isocitrate dehydrogenase